MYKSILTLTLLPMISFASVYNCQGSGFVIDVGSNPTDMKIIGNGLNLVINNIKTSATFDTTFSGNSQNPTATMRLTIKDTGFANPGDIFKGLFSISSGSGISVYNGLQCTKGIE